VAAYGQSSWMHGFDHGVTVSTQTEIRDDVEELNLHAVYTLGGRLDIGAGIDVTSPLFIGSDNYTMIGYMSYGYLIFKQSNAAPFSFRISGTYGFSNSTSPFYTNQRLNKRGNGFTVQLGFFYDFTLADWVNLRIKAMSRYKNFLYTTTLGYTYEPPEEELPTGAFDPSIYPVTERETSWIFGPALGFQFFLNDSSSIILETELRITPEGTLTVAPSLGAAFGN
ncbi:MAG: hypothetical protein ACLFST_14590, partial [Spirochaetia bacterium]